MTDASANLPKAKSDRQDAIAIVQRLRDAGHTAYFAGGCVRDEVMGLVPTDYDVATDAPPPRVRELFTNTQAVGAAFGVILVRHGRSIVEVATFRADLTYEDGRRPTAVRFTTAEEDASRRDFTINGLFLDPIENKVIDYVGGQADIAARVVRAIGEPSHRFDEDHLRLLRAVRFASRFQFEIEPQTTAAIRTHAAKLARISPERIAEELRLMLTSPSRVRAVAQLRDLGLVEVILRQFPANPGFDLALIDALPANDPVEFGLAMAALVFSYRLGSKALLELTTRGESRSAVDACRNLLRISNDEADLLHDCLALEDYLDERHPLTVSKIKRLMAKPAFASIHHMIEAHAKVGHFLPRASDLLREFERFAGQEVAPPPLVTGDDLVARGLFPGPAFKRALDYAYDQQLEGQVTTRDEALGIAQDKVREFERQKPARGLD